MTSSIPTLKEPHQFDASQDAAVLYKAMKGLGTDETSIIGILCQRSCAQRQQIALNFKSAYGKELIKNLESETSGNLKALFRALMLTPLQLEVRDLRKAVEGWGTDEESLIDIVCTKSNAQMTELKNAYKQTYQRNMEDDVQDDVSGYFKRFLVSLMSANRACDTTASNSRAVQLAKELYEAGEKRLGTNEVAFNRIFAMESYAQLRLVFDAYEQLAGHVMEDAIRSEMSSNVGRAFLTVAQMARNPVSYYAHRLYESMKGIGTKDRTLVRLMTLRCEKDLASVKEEFARTFHSSLETFIKNDTSSHYRRALLCLAGDPAWK